MKLNLSLIIITLLSILVVNAGSAIAQSFKFSPAIVYFGYKDDGSFIQAAFQGVERFKLETGIEVLEINTLVDDQYEQSIQTALDMGANVIIGLGFNWADAIAKKAQSNTLTRFIIIDVEHLKRFNIQQYAFKEQEGGYLAGVLAGLMSKNGKVGYIGGMDIPVVQRYGCGFLGGAKSINPEIEVFNMITGKDMTAFIRPAEGYRLAMKQINAGVDVIYLAAGATGTGVIMAAKEHNIKVIGTEGNQDLLAPDTVLGTVQKRVDSAVYQALTESFNGEFSSGVKLLGLHDMGLSLYYNPNLIPSPDVLDKINFTYDRLLQGQLRIKSYDSTTGCDYEK